MKDSNKNNHADGTQTGKVNEDTQYSKEDGQTIQDSKEDGQAIQDSKEQMNDNEISSAWKECDDRKNKVNHKTISLTFIYWLTYQVYPVFIICIA